MTAAEKVAFIRELISNVEQGIISNVAYMPENWDGHELRRYIADTFELAAFVQMNPQRYKEYKNTLLVKNL